MHTNEYLYEDIALWEKTEGVALIKSKSLNGFDGSEVCLKEVGDKVKEQKVTNIDLVGEVINDFSRFENHSIEMVLFMTPCTLIFQKRTCC